LEREMALVGLPDGRDGKGGLGWEKRNRRKGAGRQGWDKEGSKREEQEEKK
jgi:hypothetical protein